MSGEGKKTRRKTAEWIGTEHVKYRGYSIVLPPDHILETFKEMYPHKSNEVLAQMLDKSVGYVSRLGNYFGLAKTAECVNMLHKRRVTDRQKERIRTELVKRYKEGRLDHLKKWQFQKGSKSNVSPEIHRRNGQKRKETIEKEKVRMKYGLPRKTRLKIGRDKSMAYRSCLRTRYGYEQIDRKTLVTDHDANFKFRKAFAYRKYGLRLYLRSEWEAMSDTDRKTVARTDWKDKQGGFND